ncbi:acyl-CoA N-acyltransferase [Westerdykella ornata]|uniref:Acyl-CoA N-acyltransferase n=1 Tax=Westerdykella ornata TaxID=318751 RepID=A0A6A6JEP5_WESOR|nr:acyl-CoA N-acyltransferase [Westerdykella ornata]KAF2274643.1 acyl-CoA N-acyltransferase [Westerdykella ornata]
MSSSSTTPSVSPSPSSTPLFTPKPRSNLFVSPLLPHEAHLYQAIRHETFRPTINKILYSREPSQATQDKIIQKIREDLDKGVLYIVCRDADNNGEIIAGARWRYLGPKQEDPERTTTTTTTDTEKTQTLAPAPGNRTWEEVEADLTIPDPYPESHPAAFRALCETFNANKRDILGTRPYYVLDTLVTHPDHHRRGAGGTLVAWGCEQADKKGVEAYLEASPMGKPLYERFGFREVRTVCVDLRELGAGDERFEFILMRRPPKGERRE